MFLDVVFKAGKFSAPAKAFHQDLWDFTGAELDFIAVSEVGPSDPQRGAQLATFPEYGHYHPKGLGASETGQMWLLPTRTEGWDLLESSAPVLTRKSYRQRSGRDRAPTTATLCVYENAVGVRVLVTAAHMPSSVDGKRGFSGFVHRVRTFRGALKGWRRAVRKAKREWDVDVVIVLGDFNLDANKLWVRAYLRTAWSLVGLKPAWTKDTLRWSIGGTHGKRVIDHCYYSGARLHDITIGRQTPASDHRPIFVSFTG